jgi:NAD(P)-dependent dehydrogenase (short-subunit alcohol dehydrogenase family)
MHLGLGGYVQNTSLDWGLAGKPVIVTGASSGIGAATVRGLGAAGASVLLVGRDEGRLNQQVAKVAAAGGRGVAAIVDLADAEAAAGLVDRAVEEFGSLHGMVLAASLFDPRPLEDTSLGCLDTQWRTNVLAPMMMTKRAVPHLGEGSSIVFIGSTTGSVGFPGCSAYSATKGAVAAVTRALAVELAPKGIRVNIVVPGYVRTPMLQPHLDANAGYEDWIVANTPLGRIDGPEELAPTIVFLLSPLSAYIDGQTFIVDGGWTAR